ncbi:MAG: hypothetical protein HC896_02690 [Bacteroidales bacterium]|nr:hypothetical protein [Bacteroidales bacterium]
MIRFSADYEFIKGLKLILAGNSYINFQRDKMYASVSKTFIGRLYSGVERIGMSELKMNEYSGYLEYRTDFANSNLHVFAGGNLLNSRNAWNYSIVDGFPNDLIPEAGSATTRIAESNINHYKKGRCWVL